MGFTEIITLLNLKKRAPKNQVFNPKSILELSGEFKNNNTNAWNPSKY